MLYTKLLITTIKIHKGYVKIIPPPATAPHPRPKPEQTPHKHQEQHPDMPAIKYTSRMSGMPPPLPAQSLLQPWAKEEK